MKIYKVMIENDGYADRDIYRTIYVAVETIESAIVDASQVVDLMVEKFKAKNHPEYQSLRIREIEECGEHVVGNAYAQADTDKWVETVVKRCMKEING